MKQKVFFQNLDGFRFFCFLSVFLFHSFHTEYDDIKSLPIYYFIKKFLFANGNIGVNAFFVLSGFLITFLLLKEIQENGKINIYNFWIRRILRIWPLYFFCVFFGFVLFPMLKTFMGQQSNETASLWYYFTFLNNFDFIQKGLPDCSVLGVLWSIAVEEQFYFFWPIFLYLIPARYYPYLFGGILLISLVFRACYDTYIMHEHHTLSCIGDMATGAIGAYAVQTEGIRNKIANWKKSHLILLYLCVFITLLFRKEIFFSNFYIRIVERLVIAIMALCIILEQNYCQNSLFKFSNFKRISQLGIITYGLYCLHFIGILIAIQITAKLAINHSIYSVLFLETGLALGITILISSISYKYYETPFLKWKNKF